MQGRRLPDSLDGSMPELQPGDYYHDVANDLWFNMTPNGLIGFLK